MKNYFPVHVLICGFIVIGCGRSSVLQRFEKKPKDLKLAARLLEEGNPEEAQTVLRSQMPETSGLILQTKPVGNSTGESLAYSKELAASMKGVANGEKLLSMYATAEAQIQGVNALNILVDIVDIDNNLKKKEGSKLYLYDSTSDKEAIATFYPAMPKKCKTAFKEVNKALDKALAIIYSTVILRGMLESDMTAENDRAIRRSVSKANMFNAGIFCQVNFICEVMGQDTDGDTVISDAEAANISLELALEMYRRIDEGIASVQALVDANPKDSNLAKALERMVQYKSKIDNGTGKDQLQRLKDFLVSQSNRS
ncbi:MAG: hypothetical protein HQK54_02840 [Oligoflexales bacterium]|nr:hypothetical protein [Oligoflexales bacterium]